MVFKSNVGIVRAVLVVYLPHRADDVTFPASLERVEIECFETLPVIKA